MKFVALFLVLTAHTVLSQNRSGRPDQLWEQGKSAHDEGRLQMALALYDECLRKAPDFFEAYLSRAATRERLNDVEGALTDYSIYLEKRPDHYDALFARANLRYRVGKYEQALEDYRKLLVLVPAGETTVIYYQQSPSAIAGSNRIMTAQSMAKPLIYNYIGMTETRLKNYSSALQWLDSAISLQPREPDYFVNRGLARQGLQDSLAEDDFRKALSLNPGHTAALSNLSVKQRGQVAKPEVDYLEEAIDSDSTMLYPYLERAYQRMEGGYWKGAEEDYTSALELEKKDPEIWMGRAITREKQNKFEGAYKDYTECLRLKEDNVRAWVNRGNVLVKQNLFNEAIDDYTVALTFDAAFGPAYYNRAIARERLKQYEDACADLKQAEALGSEAEAKLREKVCK